MDKEIFDIGSYMAAPVSDVSAILRLKEQSEQDALKLDKPVIEQINLQVNHVIKEHLTTMTAFRPVFDSACTNPELLGTQQNIRSVVVVDFEQVVDKTPKGIQTGKMVVIYLNGFANDVFYVTPENSFVLFCNRWFNTSEYKDLAKKIKPKKAKRKNRRK